MTEKSSRVILRNVFPSLFLLAFFLFSLWLMFHTFSYDTKTSAMLIATKTWSDFGAHIPLIRSFSQGDNWLLMLRGELPQYPLFPGEPIRYHFLFYFLVGMLEKVGFRIDWALNLPSALGFFLMVTMIYLLGTLLFADRRVGTVAVIFFLFNGSLSFVRFVAQHPLSLKTVSDIATTVHFPSFAPWGPGDVTAFWNLNIYTNQRHLALAFGLALAVVYLCLKLESKSFKQQLPWVPLVVLVLGVFPYFHQPTLLILGIFLTTYFLVFARLRWFLLMTGVLTALLIVPQLSLLMKGPKLVSWYPGYLIHDSLTFVRFISYWWQNLGLHSILILTGWFMVPGWMKRALLPIFIVFALANLFRFSVEIAASHKFFNFFLILGNILSAWMVVRGFNIAKTFHPLIRLLACALVCLLFFLLIFSGIIDFFAIKNDPRGPLPDIPDNRVADWITRHTPTNAVFLNSSFFFNPASLAGRKVFLGWPYFAWSAGYDTGTRLRQQKAMLEAKDLPTLCALARTNRIDYALTEEPQPQSEFTINYQVFADNLPLLFQNRQRDTMFRLYEVGSICAAASL